MLDYQVLFYGNTLDDMHCMQACFRMILKFFWPERDFSWEELDKITAKEGDFWTWPFAGMVWLKKNGFDVKNIEEFDYEVFIRKPKEYLEEMYGKEVMEVQITHSNMTQEMMYAKEFVSEIETELRVPTIQDIKDLLTDGYLVMCNVNSCVLNGIEGYLGHFVLLKGYTDSELIIHDPGLPLMPDKKVSYSDFERAWAYPDEKGKGISAFRFTKGGVIS